MESLVGQRFGQCEVLGPKKAMLYKGNYKAEKWHCVCSCGVSKYVEKR